MNRKRGTKAEGEKLTLRIEGAAPLARLQELLRREPKLKLQLVAPRAGPPPPRPAPAR